MILTPELAQLLERTEAERQTGYARGLHALGGDGAWQEIGGGIAASMGAGYPVNRGFALGIVEPLEAAHLDALEGFLEGRGVPAALDLCSVVDASAYTLLAARGYRLGVAVNHYALALDTYTPFAPNLSVHVLENIEDWLEPAPQVWEYAPDDPMHTTMQLAFGLPGALAFGWKANERLEALGALQLTPRVATLYSAGTAPAARGRGAQTALLHARLRTAKAHGCEWATSSAVPGLPSARNLERAGFRLVYTRLRFVKPMS
jgi:GNAT superfamily N-acetyltransferase